MYHSTSPQLIKKPSMQKKKTHISFDFNDGMQTEEDTQKSVVQQLLKRQNQLLEQEKHQKISKRSKRDDSMELDQPTKQPHSTLARQQTNYQHLNRPSLQQKPKTSPQQSIKIQQQKSLQLLRSLLFHPNRVNPLIMNTQIANQWILDHSTPTKIKSFLMLYMILYQFDNVQFKFRKTLLLETQDFKQISIEEICSNQRNTKRSEEKEAEYKRWRQNQMRKYLADYLEWLIWKNQHAFQIGPGNVQFWSMALNNCEKVATQLIKSENNKRNRQRNVFLALFLMNAEDVVFRSSLKVPKTQRNIMFMLMEDLQMLPKCHWLLGLNFSVRYFYKKEFNQRVKESLNPDNVDPREIGQFYHEYQMLTHYFCQKNDEKLKNNINQWTLSDKVLEWVAVNLKCRAKQLSEVKQDNLKLNQDICRSLLSKTLETSNDHDYLQGTLLLTAELLQRERFLSNEEKDSLLSEILYKNEKIASKLGHQFPSAVSKLQHCKQTLLPELFQRLTNQYNKLYSHLILSQHPNIKNDLLAQLRHLTDIDIEMQTPEITQRIQKIIVSFNLITHWNKDVLRTLVVLVEKQIQRLEAFVQKEKREKKEEKIVEEGKQVVQENQGKSRRTQQLSQLKTICSFLKIHINLEPLNLFNLAKILQLSNNATNNKTTIPIEPTTVSFIKKDLLSMLFSKNAFNETLLSQIKRVSVAFDRKIQIKDNDIRFVKKHNLLEQLKLAAQGIRYIQNQIDLLKQEAEHLDVNGLSRS